MGRLITWLLLAGLVSSCTKSGAVKGIGVGAGMMLFGGIVIATEGPSGRAFISDREFFGGATMAGGFVVGSVSLLARIIFAIAGEPNTRSGSGSPSPSPSPPADPGSPTEHCGIDGNCVPIPAGVNNP